MYDKIFDYNKSNVTIAYKDSYAGLVNVNTGKPITDFIYDIIEDKNSCNLSDLIAFEDDYNDNPYLRYGRHVIRNGDYFTMRKNNKWGLLDKNGKVIFDFKYRRPINLLGVFVIPGYYVVQAGRREGVLDKNSNIILEPVYDHIMQNKNYWSCEKNDRFGLADVNGNMVADIKYISVNIS